MVKDMCSLAIRPMHEEDVCIVLADILRVQVDLTCTLRRNSIAKANSYGIPFPPSILFYVNTISKC